MEFDNKTIALPNDHSSENQLDLRNIIEKYLIHWKWFILSASIFIAIGFYTLNFKRQVFQASTTIKIKNEQQGDRSALSVFQDLGVMAPASQNVEDEMEILMSRDLIAEVIKSLKLNVQIFTDKNYLSTFLDKNLSFNTHFYENENYTNPPITINFILNDSILEKTRASFVISINSTNNFTFINLDESFDKSSGNRYAFGKKIETNFGDIIITPNPAIESKELIGLDALIRITPLRELANTYADRIEIEPKSDYSSVLSLKISDGTKVKAESFLEELVNKYNERAIRLKDELTKSTSNFVTRRLEIISNELSDVDLTAESIKTRYQISDAASETGLNMQSGQAVENQIVQANTQLEKIGYIKEFVATKDENDLIPIDVGVADNNVSSTMQQYNELMMQKKRLLENSTEKNPIVVNLNEQLKTLKFNIDQGLNNLESSQKISLDALNRQDLRINSRLYSAPRQERQYRDVQRQQQIKEALYLYLLQKREETAITLGVADPNAKIIDSPESLKNPISPKKTRTLFGFIILGIVFPIGVIYLVDLLDTKIQTKEDVERVLNIPIIGDIPKFESNKNYLIKKDDYSSVAEAFRILRTNLNFILPKSLDSKENLFLLLQQLLMKENHISQVTLLLLYAMPESEHY